MEENGVLAPVFSKQPCYPKCGERTKQQIYLTETGVKVTQEQLPRVANDLTSSKVTGISPPSLHLLWVNISDSFCSLISERVVLYQFRLLNMIMSKSF